MKKIFASISTLALPFLTFANETEPATAWSSMTANPGFWIAAGLILVCLIVGVRIIKIFEDVQELVVLEKNGKTAFESFSTTRYKRLIRDYALATLSVAGILTVSIWAFNLLNAPDQSTLLADASIEEQIEPAAPAINENTVTLLTDDQEIQIGKTIFASNCAACHGQNGEGGVGPNLTDDYWLHGGDIKDIFQIIQTGVPEKGMIAWDKHLKPKNIQQVASFIVTLNGSNPENAKAPEGELYERNETVSMK